MKALGGGVARRGSPDFSGPDLGNGGGANRMDAITLRRVGCTIYIPDAEIFT